MIRKKRKNAELFSSAFFFFLFKTVSFEFKSVIVQLVSVEEIK